MAPNGGDIRTSLLRSDEVGDPSAMAETGSPMFPGTPGAGQMGGMPGWWGSRKYRGLAEDIDELYGRKQPIQRRHVHDLARRAIKKDREKSPYRGPAWGLHNRVLDHFQARHGKDSGFVEQPGEYWSTAEVIFNVDGDKGLAAASIDKGSDFEAFTEHLGQNNAVRMGQSYTTTTADTNLSHPSQLTYVDEVFMITDISARFGGLRIAYEPGDLTNLGLSGHLQNMVTGKTEVWDQQGLILPKDFFDDCTGELLLLKILRCGAIVSFKWTDTGAGGNAQSKTIVVDTFDKIPITGVRNLKSTSGGARSHNTKDGYLWTLNNNFELSHDSGGNGLFTAALQVQNDIAMPFTPITIKGSAERLRPVKIGVYIELRLHGIGYWSQSSPRQTSRHGRARSMDTVQDRFKWW